MANKYSSKVSFGKVEEGDKIPFSKNVQKQDASIKIQINISKHIRFFTGC